MALRFIRRAMVLLVAVWALANAAVYAAAMMLVDFRTALIPAPQPRIQTADGRIVPLGGELRLPPLRPGQLPRHVGYAVLASEGRTFYANIGISARGIARAAWVTARGGKRQGGSGIEQQLAKNTRLDRLPTWLRKLIDPGFSFAMDTRLSKNEILRLYLDAAYFGAGARGIKAAAVVCYGKPVEKLTVGEGALLAAALSAPSRAGCGRARSPGQRLSRRTAAPWAARRRPAYPGDAGHARSGERGSSCRCRRPSTAP